MVDEVYECPTCSRSFETKRGRSVHHTSVHGEQLPNRTCAHCEDAFRSDYRKKYCSDRCRRSAVSFSGRSNPNYRNAKDEADCRICATTFEYYPSEKEGVYCPDCVESEQWQEPPAIDGPDNPRWNGGKRTVSCDVCGDAVERYPSNLGEVVCCGEGCRREWLSDAFTGEGHPNWEGGPTGPYGPGWSRPFGCARTRRVPVCDLRDDEGGPRA